MRKPNTDIKCMWNQGSDLRMKVYYISIITIWKDYCQMYKIQVGYMD